MGPEAVSSQAARSVPRWGCLALASGRLQSRRLPDKRFYPAGKLPHRSLSAAVSGGTGVSPLSQLPVPGKSTVGFALSRAGVRMGVYRCSLPGAASRTSDGLCCVLVPVGTGMGGSLRRWGPLRSAVCSGEGRHRVGLTLVRSCLVLSITLGSCAAS